MFIDFRVFLEDSGLITAVMRGLVWLDDSTNGS
jgi:hypothetical protein